MATTPDIPGTDQSYAQTMMDKLADDFDEDEVVQEALRRVRNRVVADYFKKLMGDYDSALAIGQSRISELVMPFSAMVALLLMGAGAYESRAYGLVGGLVGVAIFIFAWTTAKGYYSFQAVNYAVQCSPFDLDGPVHDLLGPDADEYTVGGPLDACGYPTASLVAFMVDEAGSSGLRTAIQGYERGLKDGVDLMASAGEPGQPSVDDVEYTGRIVFSYLGIHSTIVARAAEVRIEAYRHRELESWL